MPALSQDGISANWEKFSLFEFGFLHDSTGLMGLDLFKRKVVLQRTQLCERLSVFIF